MRFYAKSDKGQQRKVNQDSYGCHISTGDIGFFIVADGMGGHNAGEVASALAVETFINSAKENVKATDLDSLRDFISENLKKANETILYKASLSYEQRGMGTTAVVAIVSDGKTIIGNVGDSRAYHVTQGKILQITSDHSYVEQLLKAGSIDAEEAKNHPRQNEITKAIGDKYYTMPDFFECDCNSGDALLLCSDGLNKMISDTEILDIITSNDEPEKICDTLIKAANDAGGRDNITAIVILF